MAVAPQAAQRPRTGGGRLFIIIGAVLALVATGLLIFLGLVTNRGGGGGGGTGCPCSYVIYAAKDISLRTQILSQDQVQVKQVPQSIMPASAWTVDKNDSKAAFAAVQNQVAEVNISANDPLLKTALAKPGDIINNAQAAFLPIPDGYVAFQMPTGEMIGVGGWIQPGDYISILASAGSGKTSVTVTVFTQLHVLRIGPANLTVTQAGTTQQANSGPVANASSMTVVVTPCQAEFLTWFQNYTALKYVLESYKNYAQKQGDPPPLADPNCKSVEAAKGVTAKDILAKFPQFALPVQGA